MHRGYLTEKERALMYKAFMMGREYAKNGEQESPTEIYKILEKNCEELMMRYMNGNI